MMVEEGDGLPCKRGGNPRAQMRRRHNSSGERKRNWMILVVMAMGMAILFTWTRENSVISVLMERRRVAVVLVSSQSSRVSAGAMARPKVKILRNSGDLRAGGGARMHFSRAETASSAAANKRRTHFIILIAGRSGSTLLVDLLNQHPNVLAKGESVTTREVNTSMTIKRLEKFYREGILGLSRGGYRDVQYDFGTLKAFGFKTKKSDLFGNVENLEMDVANNLKGFYSILSFLVKNDIKVICNFRHNVFKHTISKVRQQRLIKTCGTSNVHDSFTARACEEAMRAANISEHTFLTTYKSMAKRNAHLKSVCRAIAKNVPVFWVSYEQLTSQTVEMKRELHEFLGVPPIPADLRPTIHKVTSNHLNLSVPNIADLETVYKRDVFDLFDFADYNKTPNDRPIAGVKSCPQFLTIQPGIKWKGNSTLP